MELFTEKVGILFKDVGICNSVSGNLFSMFKIGVGINKPFIIGIGNGFASIVFEVSLKYPLATNLISVLSGIPIEVFPDNSTLPTLGKIST